jgi:hypothetical protein
MIAKGRRRKTNPANVQGNPGAVRDPKLAHDMTHVNLNSALFHAQHNSNVLVGFAFAEKVHDSKLPWGPLMRVRDSDLIRLIRACHGRGVGGRATVRAKHDFRGDEHATGYYQLDRGDHETRIQAGWNEPSGARPKGREHFSDVFEIG